MDCFGKGWKMWFVFLVFDIEEGETVTLYNSMTVDHQR